MTMAHSKISRRHALALLGGAGTAAFSFSMPAIAQQSSGRVVVGVAKRF